MALSRSVPQASLTNFASSHTISLEQLLPILMSRGPSSTPAELPFKFTGGFAYSTKAIGIILSVQGVLQMIAQLWIFPWVSGRLGSLRTFYLTLATYPFLYLIAPYLGLLPRPLRIPGVVLILAWKVTAQSLSYPSLNIMMANAAPSKKVLGTLYGAAASSASVCRGIGPTFSGAIESRGSMIGYSGLSWWACGLVAFIGWIPGAFMKEERRRPGFQGLSAEDEDAETGLRPSMSSCDSDTESVVTLAPEETVERVFSK